MDDSKTLPAADGARFLPPRESHITTIANGIGNGLMVGILPIAGWELYHKFKDPHASRAAIFATVSATAIGCIAGAIYGNHEANKMKEYRNNVSEELLRLRAEVQAQKQHSPSWVEKQAAAAKPKETAVS